jgi:flavin-dependent dehydrogenase
VNVGKTETDVFVVGGGPAGLATAIAARKRGMSAIVADGNEPPIDKACGEGMMPETLAAVASLGGQCPVGAGYRFRGIRYFDGNVQVSGDFSQGPGLGIRRTILHERLIASAEACGVRLFWRTPVCGISADGVQLRSGSVTSRWIVGADGTSSRVRRWSGLDSTVPKKQRYATRRHYRIRPWSEYAEIYWTPRSQAYVTPINCDEVCVVVAADRMEDASFDGCLGNCPRLRDRLEGAELASRERGAVTMFHSLPVVYSGNVALVGDASGVVDAITGEGLRLAFKQAVALAEAMEEGDLENYARAHRALARKPRFMGNLLLTLASNDRFRARVMGALATRPQLFSRLLQTHCGSPGFRDWISTGVQVGWRLLTA